MGLGLYIVFFNFMYLYIVFFDYFYNILIEEKLKRLNGNLGAESVAQG